MIAKIRRVGKRTSRTSGCASVDITLSRTNEERQRRGCSCMVSCRFFLFGRELDPLRLDDTAFEKVANFPCAGVVAMPEESNDSHLRVAVPGLVSHAISPRPRQNTSRSGGPPSP